jgi:Xaa-Pro aminopeptidase
VPAEALEARRSALMELLNGTPAVFGSSQIRSIEGDYPQDSDFRQDNDFFYLTGLESRESWLVLNVPRPGAVRLYLPRRDPGEERWTGPVLGPGAEAAARTGITDVLPAESFPGDMAKAPEGTIWVSRGHPSNDQVLDVLLENRTGPVESPAPLLARLRLVKDAEEVRRLRQAVEITASAMREGWRVLEPGMHEYELEAVVEFGFRRKGAERVGFPSIIGSGPNSTVLHYDKSRRRMETGELVVMDVGAEFGYYSADITRTVPVGGTFTPRQRALYELVLGAQEAALARVRPGATLGELTRVARDYMDRHAGDLCGGDPCSRYFVHGLGHWLGMDVHDVGDYGTPLAEGMVITIEPGVYLPGEEIGIRIEDDVLVTSDGYELLSGMLPRHPDAVEAAMAESPRQLRPGL